MNEARKFRIAFAKQGTNAISNGSIIQALDLESAAKSPKRWRLTERKWCS